MYRKLSLSLAVLLGVSAAEAQSWTGSDGKIQYTFQGCVQEHTSVLCNMLLQPLKGDMEITLTGDNTNVVALDGTKQEARMYAVGNSSLAYTKVGAELFQGVATKVQVQFPNLPESQSVLARLTIEGKTFTNVPLNGRPLQVSSAPAPVRPATVSAQVGSTYNAVLSNCKQQGANLVCTATLSPR